MRAVRLTIRTCRGVLVAGELATPEPGHYEVRARLGSAALNPMRIVAADLFLRWITCSDGAGVVDRVGPMVAESWVGKRACGCTMAARWAPRPSTSRRRSLAASAGRELMQLNVTLYPMSLPSSPPAVRKRAQSDIAQWIAGGPRVLSVAEKFPLHQAAAAHEAVERGDKAGTVVIECAR